MGPGGVVVAHLVTVARVISKSIPPPPPPRVMVNRGRSAVRVSVPVCRPNLSGAACSGFWCAMVWQSQLGRCACYCSNGFVESPVQAALRSAGWDKSRDSSLRVTQNKALSFCWRDCCVPLCCIFMSWLCLVTLSWHSCPIVDLCCKGVLPRNRPRAGSYYLE